MSSYDQPRVISMNLGVIDFGNGANVTFDVPLPLGTRTVRVLDILARVTEAFNTTDTPAIMMVGRAGDLDEFASLTIPDTTAVNVIKNFRTAGGGLNSIYVAEAGGTAVLEALRCTAQFGTDAGGVTGQAEITVVYEVDYVQADL